MDSKELTLVGLHLQKCAGTTLIHRALAALPYNAFSVSNFSAEFLDLRPRFMHVLQMRPKAIRLAFGHHVNEDLVRLIGAPIFLFTGMRDPKARCISQIRHAARHKKEYGVPLLDLERYVDHEDPMCRMVVGHFPSLAGSREDSWSARAKRVLENFHFVYFTETFEQTMTELFELLAVSPERIDHNVDDYTVEYEDLERWILDMRGDYELYEWARERFAGVRVGDAAKTSPPGLAALLTEKVDREEVIAAYFAAAAQNYETFGVVDQVTREN